MTGLSLRRLLAAALLLILGGCSRKSGDDGAPPNPGPKDGPTASPSVPPVPNGPIAHITGSDLIAHIQSSGAKGTVVNAWASWCGPCRREFPMLIALRDNLESLGIRVVFVSVDEEESEGAAHDFASTRGLSDPILVASRPLGPFKQALNPNWPGMLPATFLFDAKGKLRYFWGGPVYENELLPIIEGFLAGKNIDGEARFGLRPGKDFRGE